MKDILPKKFNENQFKATILRALRKSTGGVTQNDIVVLSGLPSEWVEYSLRHLIGQYPCRLRINEKGELLYFFDLEPQKQWKSKILDWVKNFEKKGKLAKRCSRFLQYLLSDTSELKQKLLTEKILLNYIRNKQGKIVVAELIQLTGWSIRKAETQAVRLLADYNGQVEVSPDGVIIYHFEELAKENQQSEDIGESLKIWERATPEKESGEFREITRSLQEKYNNIYMFSSSVAALLMSYLMMSQQLSLGLNIFFSLITGSFTYSAVFILLPALHHFYIDYYNEKNRIRNVETFLLKGIFKRIETQIKPEKDLKKLIFESRPSRQFEYWWNPKFTPSAFEYAFIRTSTYHRETLLSRKALELEAEISVDEEGNVYYDFERLKKELKTVQTERLKLPEK